MYDQARQTSAQADLWRQPLSSGPFFYFFDSGFVGFGRNLISLFTRTNTEIASVVHADGVF